MLSRAVLLLLSVLLGDLPGCLDLDLESPPRAKPATRVERPQPAAVRLADRGAKTRPGETAAVRDSLAVAARQKS